MTTGANTVSAAITVATTATLIAAARFGRDSVMIQNLDAAAISVGGSNVTMAGATAGIQIPANGSVTLDTFNGPLYAISTAGTAANAVRVLEVY